MNDASAGYDQQTLRVVVTPNFGGERARIRLSNALGEEPTTLSSAHVGLADTGAAVQQGTNRPLTFNGSSSVTIPAGESVLSDAADLPVKAFEPLVVSFYAPAPTGPASGHGVLASMYVADGDHAADESGTAFGSAASGSRFLTAVDVFAPNDGVIVAYGDSITEGFSRERIVAGQEAPWTDTFARRLHAAAAEGGPRLSVVNAGISGNRVLEDGTGPSAVSRLDRDVLSQSGLAGVIMMEGINDLATFLRGGGPPPSLEAMAAGYTDIIGRVKAAGADMWLSPLTPAGDSERPTPFTHSITPEHVERRHDVNRWIRAQDVYDGRVDFEPVVKDLQEPNWIRAEYDTGDNLHPNNAGLAAMGESIDLAAVAHLACDAKAPDAAGPTVGDGCGAAPSWVASWALPVSTTYDGYADQTLRVVLSPNFAGDRVRIRLSNALGEQPVTLANAHVGTAADGAAVVPGSNTPLTFGGSATVTIPAGESVLSDPANLRVEAFENIAVSVYAPEETGPASGHDQLAMLHTAAGDQTTDEEGSAFGAAAFGSHFLTAVDVFAPNDGVIVALGDSITEGTSRERMVSGEEAPWTDTFAQRLHDVTAAGGPRMSVVNVGIGGNRVLEDGSGPAAVNRLDRDVLAQSGLAGVIMMEGINDLAPLLSSEATPPSLDAMAAGYSDIAQRVQAAGAGMWLSPLTPGGDLERPTPYTHSMTPEHVQRRHEVNRWIRGQSGVYDGRVDFESVVFDPQEPNWIRADYDTGDNLHPNNAGLAAMGASIDLTVLDELPCPRPQVCAGLPTPQYTDRASVSAVHRVNVDCVIARRISVGVTSAEGVRYGPAERVTRAQMASFVVNTLSAAGLGDRLPSGRRDQFGDIASSAHRRNINRLARAGIVRGRTTSRFAPRDTISRAEMATFMVAAAEFAREERLTAKRSHFRDVRSGSTHHDTINAGYEAGLFSGTGEETFAPSKAVRRDQMASFLIRLLASL